MDKRDSVARAISAVMASLFIYAAIVQYNDPDPLLWIAIYGAAALVCGLGAAGRPAPSKVVAAIALTATLWSLWLASIVFGGGELHEMFPEEEQTGTVIVDAEEGREMGGLAIVSFTLIGLVMYQRHRD